MNQQNKSEGTPTMPTLEEWLLQQYPGANLDKLEIPARVVIEIAKSYAATRAVAPVPQAERSGGLKALELYYAQKDGCKKHGDGRGKICVECVAEALDASAPVETRQFWPRQKEPRDGWIISTDFLMQIAADTRVIDEGATSWEGIEAVLLAAEAFSDKSEAGLLEEIEFQKRERWNAENYAKEVEQMSDKFADEIEGLREEIERLDKESKVFRQLNEQLNHGIRELRAKLAEQTEGLRLMTEIAGHRQGEWDKAESRAEAAEAEVAALRERERWIPVSERLPEIGQEVYAGAFIISTFADGSKTTNWQQALMIWDGRIWRDSESGDEDDASHWKALSAAPERGKDGKS